ncbi:hypothetical protein VTI74DRAFT_610 [Chaetomium olivicolor]
MTESVITNPIIPGFAPDPSIVLVDGTYFLVNPSFHIFPGIPVYASTDLAAWRLIGHAVNDPSKISLSRSGTDLISLANGETLIAAGGLYAPTIRHDNGKFYVICTNLRRSQEDNGTTTHQNFYTTCTDIYSNTWTDPIFFDLHGIDPSLFFDGNRAYIQGSFVVDYSQQPSCTIKQFEIDLATGQPLSPQKDLWTGSAKIDPEGPHSYKRGAFYYLLIAEGGTFEHHQVSVARSTSIWGPFEPCPDNPILTKVDRQGEHVQHTGQADIFVDQQGQWWAVVLGVRKFEPTRFPMGRETFLSKVHWRDDGWPSIDPVKPTVVVPGTGLGQGTQPGPIAGDASIYIRDMDPSKFRILEDGTMRLIAGCSDFCNADDPVSFVGMRQRKLDGRVAATLMLDPSSKARHEFTAGVALYKDEHRYAQLLCDSATCQVRFHFLNKAKGAVESATRDVEPAECVQFEIRHSASTYEFCFRTVEEQNWIQVGSVGTSDMTGYDFTGPLLGVFGARSGDRSHADVEVVFKDFKCF